MDLRELFGHALAHPSDAIGLGVGRLHLVDVAGHPVHDEERPAEHVARRLEPQRGRDPDRRGRQCAQDAELPCQVVRLEQCGR